MCSMLSEQTEGYEWTRDSGGTDSANTGPSQGDGQSQFYVYAEATNMQQGHTARYVNGVFSVIMIHTIYLISTNIIGVFIIFRIVTSSISYTGMICIRFSYHMYGEHMGELRVFTQQENQPSKTTIWSMNGDQQDVWKAEAIQLDTTGNYGTMVIN